MMMRVYSCISELIEWIEKNIESSLSATSVADKSGYSAPYIKKQFKAITGVSLSDYIKGRKLFRAALYLHFTNKSSASISATLHINSESVFCRFFKSHYGVTPGTYRKSGRLLLLPKLQKKNVYKTTPLTFTVNAVNNEKLCLYGRYFYYSIALSDFDSPHYRIRQSFRSSFFEELGVEPDKYYTMAWYKPLPGSESLVEITYFVGVSTAHLLTPLPTNVQMASVTLSNAMRFETGMRYLNPYDIIMNVNSNYLYHMDVAWLGDWDVEIFEMDSRKRLKHTYIIPVA